MWIDRGGRGIIRANRTLVAVLFLQLLLTLLTGWAQTPLPEPPRRDPSAGPSRPGFLGPSTPFGPFNRLVNTVQSGDQAGLVRILDQSPEAVRRCERQGTFLLPLALSRDRTNLVELLIRSGADVNASGPMRSPGGPLAPLLEAARRLQVVAVPQLLEAGAKVNLTNASGLTALQVATDFRFTRELSWVVTATTRGFGARPSTPSPETADRRAIVDALLAAGADVFLGRTDYGGLVPLGLALSHPKDPALLDLILTNARPVTIQSRTGNTLVHVAACAGRLEALETLLRAGASASSTNRDGWAPLHIVARLRASTAPPPIGAAGAVPGPATPNAIAAALINAGARLDVFAAAGLGDRQTLADLSLRDPSILAARDSLLGQTPLHWAVNSQHEDAVAWLVAHQAPLTSIDDEGDTPLHLAARGFSTNILRCLTTAGAPLEVTNLSGATPLALAVWQPDFVKILLIHGARAEPGSPAAEPPLLAAAKDSAEPEVVRLLLRHGANPSTTNRAGQTAIHIAVSGGGSLEGLEQLLRARADINARDTNGNTVLHHLLATQSQKGSTFSLPNFWSWFPTNAAINYTNQAGDTPLHIALRAGSTACLQELCARGADLTARNRQGETPLLLAQQYCDSAKLDGLRLPETSNSFYASIVRTANTNDLKRYLEAEPRLVRTPGRAGHLPIDWAVNAGRQLIARQLIDSGSPLTTSSAVMLGRVDDLPQLTSALTPQQLAGLLLIALTNQQRPCLRWLLEHGANPNTPGDDGRTPAGAITAATPAEDLALLQARGAKPSAFDAVAQGDILRLETLLREDPALARSTNGLGQTLLLPAIIRTNDAAVELLLRHKADVRAATPRGTTPLHAAAFVNHAPSARALIDRGADVHALDQFQLTPLHWAARAGATEVAKALVAAGADLDAQGSQRPASMEDAGGAPLHLAAEYAQTEMVRYLLAAGADPTLPNRLGASPRVHARFIRLLSQAQVNEPGLPWPPPARDRERLDAALALLEQAEGGAGESLPSPLRRGRPSPAMPTMPNDRFPRAPN